MVSLNAEDVRATRYDRQRQGYFTGNEIFEYEGDLLDYLLEQKKLVNSLRKTRYCEFK